MGDEEGEKEEGEKRGEGDGRKGREAQKRQLEKAGRSQKRINLDESHLTGFGTDSNRYFLLW